ncbi:hypothetical protein SAMN05660816_04888 [Niastella yeongjuensis]|nr:hypothetical protein SAMN05660816_04888 [Niastella yeongjuensis]
MARRGGSFLFGATFGFSFSCVFILALLPEKKGENNKNNLLILVY